MESRRRRVRRTTHFLDEAQGLFPLGGSPDGRPSFELFADRILRAVEELFARDFEGQPEAFAGIRFAMTHAVPVFPALVIYAVLADDDTVELLSITIDDDYFDLIDDDPA